MTMVTESYSGGKAIDRTLIYATPAEYDEWGVNEKGEHFEHSFCVIDDFGDAVPSDVFAHYYEGYKPFWGPDMDPTTPIGQPYKYVLYLPTVH